MSYVSETICWTHREEFMRTDAKTKDEKLQHDINRAALKIDKFEYLTGGEILHPHRRSRIHLYINCENIGKTSKNY